jgi:uncharacterized membrane protein
MKKLKYFLNELKSTFWFFPVIIVAASVALAFGFLDLDATTILLEADWARYLFIGNADSTRSVLSVISGAMIGVAGTVFSVILVALTLASSQYGSRLIKNFM